MRALEQAFERVLWESRLGVISGVIAGAVLGFGALYMSTVDVVHALQHLSGYAHPGLRGEARDDLRQAAVAGMVKALDGYLIASILFLFALGLYELFIKKIEVVHDSEVGDRLLRVRDLDDLKDRVAKLIMLVIVIEFFGHALKLEYKNAQDLLMLALAILLVSGSLYLTSLKGKKPAPHTVMVKDGGAATAEDAIVAEET
jgi:uncharacterized membrane protein YqhA